VHRKKLQAVALRHTALALVALALSAYGYGQEQDPFIAAWKLVASQANRGRWTEARDGAPALDPGLAEIHAAFGWELRTPIATALAARDSRALARELTVAACGAILWKLEASRRADLSDYYAAKYRIEAARTLYAELVAPAVRHQGATRGGGSDERVVAALARAQESIGRPGFLGRGGVPPDPAAYAEAALAVEAALRVVFPFVPEVKR
jgi:hypothetical protein